MKIQFPRFVEAVIYIMDYIKKNRTTIALFPFLNSQLKDKFFCNEAQKS